MSLREELLLIAVIEPFQETLLVPVEVGEQDAGSAGGELEYGIHLETRGENGISHQAVP